LLCVAAQLRRAPESALDSDEKELREKLVRVVQVLEKDVFPSLTAQVPGVGADALVAAGVRNSLRAMSDNFQRIHQYYTGGAGDLRSLKQAHRRYIGEVAGALELQVPKGLMLALEDRGPAEGGPGQPSVAMAPPSIPSFRPGLMQRHGLGPRLLQPPSFGPPPGFPQPQMPQPGFGMPAMPQPRFGPQIPRPPTFGPRFGPGGPP
jgi:hypothetical protein